MRLDLLDQFASAHHGIVTRTAAARLGVSKSAWYRAIASGHLQLVGPNVARVPGSPATTQQAIATAVSAAGPGALASHGSAAWLWSIPMAAPTVVDVIIPDRRRRPTVDGAAIHRPRDLLDLGAVRRDRIPTCNLLRTFCDLGALTPWLVPGAVGHAITTKIVRPEQLLRAVIMHSRKGRPGVPALRNALLDWTIDDKPPDSVLEPAFARLVRRHDLPPVEFHRRIGPFVVDFIIIGTHIVIECDGWGPHVLDRRNWVRDKVRDSEITAMGYIVEHVTYDQVVREAATTAARIRRVVARWAPHVLDLGNVGPGIRDPRSPEGVVGPSFPRTSGGS